MFLKTKSLAQIGAKAPLIYSGSDNSGLWELFQKMVLLKLVSCMPLQKPLLENLVIILETLNLLNSRWGTKQRLQFKLDAAVKFLV